MKIIATHKHAESVGQAAFGILYYSMATGEFTQKVIASQNCHNPL